MRVLLVNNYDIGDIWKMWNKEPSPGHHLWGITHLPQYGIDVDILPYEKYTILKRLSEKLKIVGDLDQQLRILFKQNQYDVIYSGHHLTTLSLAVLRSVGLFKKPVVAVTYQSFNKTFLSNLFTQLFIKGHDKLFCLTNGIEEHLRNDFHLPKEKLELLEWGVDLPFYEVKNGDVSGEENDAKFIVSAGKTYRDYTTLVKAFDGLNYPLKIYGSGRFSIPDSELPANLQVINTFVSWKEIVAECRKAYAVAIPLNVTLGTAYNAIGMTSLIEAMALGKAVVMTRNGKVGIDIEKEKIGIFVEPGDIKGWKQAISYLLENPDITKEMGDKARYLCEEKYSLEVFSSRLAKLLQQVA